MIIECTACKKKFSVPSAAITANGRLVQCSSCGNKWTQYPIKTKTDKPKTSLPTKTISPKKIQAKKSSPIPYSEEYMKQKWGTSVQDYALEKGLSKKVKKISQKNKLQKQKPIKRIERPRFGFFNYIITLSILSIFFVGVLSSVRSTLTSKFPMIEPYIDHFFETINNFKVFILDLYK